MQKKVKSEKNEKKRKRRTLAHIRSASQRLRKSFPNLYSDWPRWTNERTNERELFKSFSVRLCELPLCQKSLRLTFPNPTDVNDENVKYNAVMYLERRFGPSKHFISIFFTNVWLLINIGVQLYGWPDIRANSSSQVIRNPRRTSMDKWQDEHKTKTTSKWDETRRIWIRIRSSTYILRA